MVLEVAVFTISAGSEDDFSTAYRGAREVLAGTPGCRSVRMTHGIESPSRFVMLVEWDSVQAHEENFRQTDRMTEWRGAISPYFAAPPEVEHYTDI
jgi:heme-degrading monooxygenase HmoA